MAVEIQYPDGSYGGIREKDSFTLWRNGGYATVGVNAAATSPAYFGGANLIFNMQTDTSASDTSTGGFLLNWANNLGYDIMVTSHQLDITTASAAACSASFGQSSNSTGTSANMIATQSIHSIATVNGGALSVRVNANAFITGSVSAGTSSGVRMRAVFSFIPLPAPGTP